MEKNAAREPLVIPTERFESTRQPGLQRVIALSLLFLAILVGLMWIARSKSQRAVTDIVELVASDPGVAFETGVETTVEATSLIRDRLGIGVRIPTIEDTQLEKVSIVELARGIEIPVLGYRTAGGGEQQVFGVDYAFLDRHEGRLYIDPSLRRELEHGNSFTVVDVRGRKEVVVWRSGASILLSPTTDSGALIERIQG